MIDFNKIDKDYNYMKILKKENEELKKENEKFKLIIFKTLRRIDYTNYIECNTSEKWFSYLSELKFILNGEKK